MYRTCSDGSIALEAEKQAGLSLFRFATAFANHANYWILRYSALAVASKPVTILIVEDETFTRLMLVGELEATSVKD
jgi:hypothetical protein